MNGMDDFTDQVTGINKKERRDDALFCLCRIDYLIIIFRLDSPDVTM